MFCSNCGKPVNDGAKFCSNCGTALTINLMPPKIQTQSERIEKPLPLTLIAITWALIAINFIPIGEVGLIEFLFSLILSLVILICAILLIFSKNRIGEANGWFIFILWLVINVYSFSAGFFYSFLNNLPKR